MKVLTEIYSVDNARKALVSKDDKGYFVQFWEDGKFVELRELYDHSIHYAEDAADNWVRYII